MRAGGAYVLIFLEGERTLLDHGEEVWALVGIRFVTTEIAEFFSIAADAASWKGLIA